MTKFFAFGLVFLPAFPFCFALFASFIYNYNTLLLDHLKLFLSIIIILNAFFCSLNILQGKSFSLMLNLNCLFRKESSLLPFCLLIHSIFMGSLYCLAGQFPLGSLYSAPNTNFKLNTCPTLLTYFLKFHVLGSLLHLHAEKGGSVGDTQSSRIKFQTCFTGALQVPPLPSHCFIHQYNFRHFFCASFCTIQVLVLHCMTINISRSTEILFSQRVTMGHGDWNQNHDRGDTTGIKFSPVCTYKGYHVLMCSLPSRYKIIIKSQSQPITIKSIVANN